MVEASKLEQASAPPWLSLRAIPAVGLFTFHQLVGRRLKVVLGVLLLAFGALCLLVVRQPRVQEPASTLFAGMATGVVLVGVLPLIACYLAVQSVRGDLENKTYQYLFLRPVRRSSLLLGKWLAATAWAILVGGLAMLVCFFVFTFLRGDRELGMPMATLGWFLGGVALDAAGFTAAGVLFGAWFRWPMVWSAVFVLLTCYLSEILSASLGMDQFGFTGPVRRFLAWGLELGPDVQRVGEEVASYRITSFSRAVWPQGPSVEEWTDALLGHPVRSLAVACGLILAGAVWRYERAEYEQRAGE